MNRDHASTPLILTCEHATHEVPSAHRAFFVAAENELKSHRGWDAGAHEAALAFRSRFGAPLFAGEATRLLVDLNRSLHHPGLWSAHSGPLTWIQKERVLRRYYHPYREATTAAVRAAIARKPPAVHLSIHSLVPVLDGKRRDFEIALLFDPDRKGEALLCEAWAARLRSRKNPPRVVFNDPYKGTDDGFTTTLRGLFPAAKYLGIEIEFNQRDVSGPRAPWQRLIRRAVETLEEAFTQTGIFIPQPLSASAETAIPSNPQPKNHPLHRFGSFSAADGSPQTADAESKSPWGLNSRKSRQ